jgi:hypothetical protein
MVFTSSIAAYGAPFPEVIDDDFATTPLTSYGAQKVISEMLLADYSRRGILDGIGIRLPNICIRPGAPNKAASGFFSNILREPLAGREAVLPVGDEVRTWHASPRARSGTNKNVFVDSRTLRHGPRHCARVSGGNLFQRDHPRAYRGRVRWRGGSDQALNASSEGVRSPPCHSREGGNPCASWERSSGGVVDSRLRGNDGNVGVVLPRHGTTKAPEPPRPRRFVIQPPQRGRHRRHSHSSGSAGTSGDGISHFRLGGEPAGLLLGEAQLAVHRDLEHPAAGFFQVNPGIRDFRNDDVPRRFGARFVASHAAVFDLDVHVWNPSSSAPPA